MHERVVGWDIGGAHAKAALVEGGRLRDVAQWPCPLWQGQQHLDAVLEQARQRWPQAWADAATRHVATMTGEMVDLFETREQGVSRLATQLAEGLGPNLRLYAGERGWVTPQAAHRHWADVASANWCASAELVAALRGDAVLVDIGSTTTDLIAVCDGRVAARGRSDAQRLASGELVYHGVVRTPLCVLTPRVPFGGAQVNVMNEWFATTADVYRLTGELDPAHDQHDSADHQPKDRVSSLRRLARLIGRDAHEADDAQWLTLARHWRRLQLREIRGQLERVIAASGLPDDAPLVGAGCGDFLVTQLAAELGRRHERLAGDVLPLAADLSAEQVGWAQVCAPALAVAWLAWSTRPQG